MEPDSGSKPCIPSGVSGGGLTYLFGRKRVLLNAPALAKAVGQLKDGQDQLSLGRATLLQSCLESEGLDVGSVLRGR